MLTVYLLVKAKLAFSFPSALTQIQRARSPLGPTEAIINLMGLLAEPCLPTGARAVMEERCLPIGQPAGCGTASGS